MNSEKTSDNTQAQALNKTDVSCCFLSLIISTLENKCKISLN